MIFHWSIRSHAVPHRPCWYYGRRRCHRDDSPTVANDFRASTQTLSEAIERVDAQARRLTTMLEALRALERDMKRPLDTLDNGLVALARETTAVDPQLRRVERSVTRLKELARSMPEMRSIDARRMEKKFPSLPPAASK